MPCAHVPPVSVKLLGKPRGEAGRVGTNDGPERLGPGLEREGRDGALLTSLGELSQATDCDAGKS